MRVFITGITGLVGSNFAKLALQYGHSIKALIRPDSDLSLISSILSQIELVRGNLDDVQLLDKELHNIDWIYHAGAMVSFVPKERNQMFKTNVEGTRNLVNAALSRSISTFMFVSSVAALGNKPNAVMDESKTWEDDAEQSAYAESKFWAESEVWRGMAEGLQVLIVNPSVILGEGDINKSSSRLFKYVRDQNKFYTAGNINYVDVKDVVQVTLNLLQSTIVNERFILSAGTVTYQSFFEKISSKFNVKPPNILLGVFLSNVLWRIEYVRSIITGSNPLITKETAKSANSNHSFSSEKIKKALDYSFHDLDVSLDRICSYYKAQAQ